MNDNAARQATAGPHQNRNWQSRLLRGIALTAALGAGMTVMYAATAPSAFAGTAIAGIDGTGWFERMHGHSHAQVHAHFDQVLTKAGVNAAQKQQIHLIASDAMTAEHADMQRYHATFARLRTLLTASRIDEASVDAVRAEQDQLALATSRRLSETTIAIAKVLTPDQRRAVGAQIDQMMATGMGHHAAG